MNGLFHSFKWPEKSRLSSWWEKNKTKAMLNPTTTAAIHPWGPCHGCIHGNLYSATGPTTSRSGKLRWYFSQPNDDVGINQWKTLSPGHCSSLWMPFITCWMGHEGVTGDHWSRHGKSVHFPSPLNWPYQKEEDASKFGGDEWIPMLTHHEVDISLG